MATTVAQPRERSDSEQLYNAQASLVLHWMIFSMPQADCTTTEMVFPSSTPFTISSTTFLSSSVGSPIVTKVGKFKSSLVSPLSSSRLTSPLSLSAVKSWYSVRFTKGTSKLCEQGQRSSYFLPVKMSSATMCAFACPCFPVFDVDTSATLHGCPLIITWEPFRSSPACCGYTCEAP